MSATCRDSAGNCLPGCARPCVCRRNWRQRFFVLYPNKRLCYFEKDTVDETSKPSGVIEMANVT